jgi:Pentapeptide repeats (9 copies)
MRVHGLYWGTFSKWHVRGMRINTQSLDWRSIRQLHVCKHFSELLGFSGCHFRGCTFKGRERDFRQALLTGAVFENARFEEGGRIYVSDISGADFTKSPGLIPENIVDCAARWDNPPKFAPGVEIEYRKIGPKDLGRIAPSLEATWFVWSNALKIFPREEAMYRAGMLGIDHEYFLQTAFGEFKLRT